MKKILSVFSLVLLLSSTGLPAFAKDRAKVKVGSFKVKSVDRNGNDSVAAVLTGNTLLITLGGASVGSRSGTVGFLSIAINTDNVDLASGTTMEVFGTNNDDADSPAVVLWLFSKANRRVSKGSASNNDTNVNGTLEIVKYDEAKGQIKFKLSATGSPYTVSKQKGFTSEPTITQVDKPVKIKAAGVVTIEQ